MTKDFKSELLIDVNSDRLKGVAEGILDLDSGEVVVTHIYDNIPKKFNLAFLAVGALTGIPEPKRPIGEVTNPFPNAKKYEFHRTVTFLETNEVLEIHGGYSEIDSRTRKGRIEFIGKTPIIDDVLVVEPTTEIWVPSNNPNQIIGYFTMSWVLESGKRIVCLAKTIYTLYESKEIKDFIVPHFRFITIQLDIEDNIYRQEEQISMFQKPTEHIDKIIILDKQITERELA